MTQFRKNHDAGGDQPIHFATGQTSIGVILVAQSGRGICAIFLGDDSDTLEQCLLDYFPGAQRVTDDAGFAQTLSQVVNVIEKPGTALEMPLDIHGTAFQMRVWQALRDIPAGSTASYTAIAERIGAPRSVRAVAGACGANLIAVAIPCHRAVRHDGGLSGYRWGVERKRQLLEREGAQLALTSS